MSTREDDKKSERRPETEHFDFESLIKSYFVRGMANENPRDRYP